MFKKLALTVVALSVAAANLSAAEFYIGAGFSGEVESGSFREDLERYTSTDGDAWKLLAGVRIGDHVALEVAESDLGSQRCCSGVADLGFTSTVEGFSAVALGRWPVGRFAPFVKAGVLSWSEDGEVITLIGPSPESADGTDLLLGFGLEVDLPARLGIRAEWEHYDFESSSSDSVWASLLIRF